MKDYLRRLIKYVGFVIIIISLLFLRPLLRGNIQFGDLGRLVQENSRMQLFFIIFIAYSFVYPLLVYGKKERYINGKFDDNKEGFIKSFGEFNYTLAEEKNNSLIFRKKSIMSRIMTMGEDRVEVNYTNNPVILKGIRKDLARLDRILDVNLLSHD